MLRAVATLISLLALLAAGCGGSSGEAGEETTEVPAGSLEARWRAPGEDVSIVAGTSDYGPGKNRVSFLVVDGAGQVVSSPTARFWVAKALKAEPFQTGTAHRERIGVPGGLEADAQDLYVAEVELPGPGTYWLLAEPVAASKKIQAVGNLVVKSMPAAPTVGDRAIPSDNPTASTVAEAKKISTSKPPDLPLLRSSVNEAMAAKVPFVVTFATPEFCASRTCGPVVQVVDSVRKRFTGTPVRFIHVEIYEGNDPANGVNRWVEEWKLPTEPFTYVVGADGMITAKFEGAFSAGELETAVRRASELDVLAGALDHDDGDARRRREAKQRPRDLGAVLRLDHRLRVEPGPVGHRGVDEARAEGRETDPVVGLLAIE